MRIKTVEYTGSFGFPGGFPADPRPEVAMFGRSNVGKSSLINTLLGRDGVARTSKTPGKTRAANFFRVNDRFHIVDMPGYGYAKLPRSESRRFVELFQLYLDEPDRNNALIQLIDTRREPTDQDLESLERMNRTQRPMCIVFTKSDKVNKSSMNSRMATAIRKFHVRPDTGVIAFSSTTGNGRRELWAWIETVLSLTPR
jgi:GTP-binding protein